VSATTDQREFERRLELLVALLDERLVIKRSAATFAAAGGIDVAWAAELDDRGMLRIGQVHGARTELLKGLLIPSGWGLTGKAFVSGSIHAVDDYFASGSISHQFDPYIEAEGVRRLVAAPVVVDGRVVAVLAGGSTAAGSFGDVGLERLENAARSTSTALRAAARSRQLTEAAVQEDRHQLAANLHDNVGALLFAIQASVRDLAGSLSDNAVLRAQAESIEARATEAAAALRASLTMMHVAAPQVALEAELRGDINAFEQRSGVSTALIVFQADALQLVGARAEAIASALREALLNVEKHANANSVVVTIAHREGVVILTVTDDGCGLADTPAEGGLGLISMRRRLERLGGTADLSHPEEGGTVLRARLPL
jgi:LuxR family transcriptional regulator, regulator of acetate metabolism